MLTVDFIPKWHLGQDMEEAMETTTPFLTIDPMISNRLSPVFNALNGGDWGKVIDNDGDLLIRLVAQGVENPVKRSSIPWDDANLFFLSCLDTTKNGRSRPLEAGISKERFGRFPYGDGSAINYLREWMREYSKPDIFAEMADLLENLATRMTGTSMETGVGRMNVLGWLEIDDVTKLRKGITAKCWRPAASEPLDGGCQDAAKHLLALLRAAEKRKVGIALRIHN